jgi:hypothetical protein
MYLIAEILLASLNLLSKFVKVLILGHVCGVLKEIERIDILRSILVRILIRPIASGFQ